MRGSALALLALSSLTGSPVPEPAKKPIQVFLFAGQSNMVGADAHAEQVDDYPPFEGAVEGLREVRYSYFIGDTTSNGWSDLEPVRGSFGPELTFVRRVEPELDAPIAVIKCAVGGTTIAYDWNPAAPDEGKQLYPKAIAHIREAIEELRKKGKEVELKAMFWHQGENDMLNRELNPHYGERLTGLISAFRRDLDAPELPWFVGEISDKGIWGMDHRAFMRTVRAQQREVVAADPLVSWVPTSHLAFEVMGSGQPHYHFGTQGQLQHGEAYAEAYLATLGGSESENQPGLGTRLPIKDGETVRMIILAGQRNLEGEDAFVSELKAKLRSPLEDVLFRAALGGEAYRSTDWEPLRPIGLLGNFGPELSLGRNLRKALGGPLAILKISDSAALMSDWDPTGEDANRPIYANALAFVREALADLDQRGIKHTLEAVVWMHGENETYFDPFRRAYAERLGRLIASLRADLGQAELPWLLVEHSERAPWGEERIREMNEALRVLATEVPGVATIATSDLPHGRIHFETEGTLKLGARLAAALEAL